VSFKSHLTRDRETLRKERSVCLARNEIGKVNSGERAGLPQMIANSKGRFLSSNQTSGSLRRYTGKEVPPEMGSGLSSVWLAQK